MAVTLLAGLAPYPGAAQWQRAELRTRQTRTVVGAVVGGVLGTAGGVVLGRTLDRCPECGGVGALLGGLAGELVGVGIGAHLGNGGRGRFAATLWTSVGVGLIGFLAAAATEREELLYAAAMVQVGFTAAAALGTAARGAPASGRAAPEVRRTSSGGWRLGLRLGF